MYSPTQKREDNLLIPHVRTRPPSAAFSAGRTHSSLALAMLVFRDQLTNRTTIFNIATTIYGSSTPVPAVSPTGASHTHECVIHRAMRLSSYVTRTRYAAKVMLSDLGLPGTSCSQKQMLPLHNLPDGLSWLNVPSRQRLHP
jgi:hypothetical protein